MARSDPHGAGPLDARRLCVLVADDDPVQRRLLESMLARRGHEVRTVCDGRAAIAEWERGHIDVAFLDIEMPVMDGVATALAIRSAERASGRRTFVVALSSHASDESRGRCLAAGMNAVLVKPLGTAELDALVSGVVEELLEREEPFDFDAALHRVDGEVSYLREMAVAFVEDYPGLRDRLRDAVARRQGEELSYLSHRLAGSLLAFSAGSAERAVRRLEWLGHGDMSEADVALEAFEARVQQLVEALRAKGLLKP